MPQSPLHRPRIRPCERRGGAFPDRCAHRSALRCRGASERLGIAPDLIAPPGSHRARQLAPMRAHGMIVTDRRGQLWCSTAVAPLIRRHNGDALQSSGTRPPVRWRPCGERQRSGGWRRHWRKPHWPDRRQHPGSARLPSSSLRQKWWPRAIRSSSRSTPAGTRASSARPTRPCSSMRRCTRRF